MATSSRSYIGQDENGNEIYEYVVDGRVVDKNTYDVEVSSKDGYENELRDLGWNDSHINGLDNGDYVVDPVTKAPVTPTQLSELQADRELEAQLNAAIGDEEAINTLDAQREEYERNKENDWRVRLHLGPEADFLYKAEDPGILAPLRETDGIIFPYTPQVQVQYSADYENYDLVHSNYKGYFYRGSKVENIILTATFTANDIIEANYLLASMHFLRTCTKMFYGQDMNRGMPPPVVFLTGLGEYQFKNHPCAITSIHYNLPNDVDYIPCGKVNGIGAPTERPPRPDSAISYNRLSGSNLTAGGRQPVSREAQTQNLNDPYTKATYVPTKIDINFTMIPIQTRDQVSKEFSVKDYASGKLLKKGFW